jgi:chromosome segregation ATPase
VNYLPNRTFLTSENAPPPMNPKLQQCLQEDVFAYFADNESRILGALDDMAAVEISILPSQYQNDIGYAISDSRGTFEKVDAVNAAQAAVDDASDEYRILHSEVRGIERQIRRLNTEIAEYEKLIDDARFDDTITQDELDHASEAIAELKTEIDGYTASIPTNWPEENAKYQKLLKDAQLARLSYQNHVDNAYRPLQNVITVVSNSENLARMLPVVESIEQIIASNDADTAMDLIKEIEDQLGEMAGADEVGSLVRKARRALRGDSPDVAEALQFRAEAIEQLNADVAWMKTASETVLPALRTLDAELANNIGIRLQDSLPNDLALSIAACQSVHRNVSLNF